MNSAAQLLRSARRSAALTQHELAERAGVTQSVVSAYEGGRREPSFRTLNRLIDATGFRLEATVSTAPRVPGSRADELRSRVHANREALRSSLGRLGASRVRLFGSVARGDAHEQSDVDLLVRLNPGVGLFALAQMRSAAEQLLGVAVDIVPEDSLKPEVRATVLADVVPL